MIYYIYIGIIHIICGRVCDVYCIIMIRAVLAHNQHVYHSAKCAVCCIVLQHDGNVCCGHCLTNGWTAVRLLYICCWQVFQIYFCLLGLYAVIPHNFDGPICVISACLTRIYYVYQGQSFIACHHSKAVKRVMLLHSTYVCLFIHCLPVTHLY